MNGTVAPGEAIGALTLARRLGSVLSILAGAFWLGCLFWGYQTSSALHARNSTPDLVSSQTVLIFIVGPCIACIAGGWLTLRSFAGWRWPPIVVCTFYAIGLSQTHGTKQSLIGFFAAWDAVTAILLSLPDPYARLVRQRRSHVIAAYDASR